MQSTLLEARLVELQGAGVLRHGADIAVFEPCGVGGLDLYADGQAGAVCGPQISYYRVGYIRGVQPYRLRCERCNP